MQSLYNVWRFPQKHAGCGSPAHGGKNMKMTVDVEKMEVTLEGYSVSNKSEKEGGTKIAVPKLVIRFKMTLEQVFIEAAKSVWIRIQGQYRNAVEKNKKDPKPHSLGTFTELFGEAVEMAPGREPAKAMDKAVKFGLMAIQQLMKDHGISEAEAKVMFAKQMGLVD
jgi:hypothetical protein